MANRNSDHKESKPFNNFLKYSSLGLQLLFTIAIAGYIGYWIDQKLDLTFPFFLLILILVAFGGAMYKLYRDIQE